MAFSKRRPDQLARLTTISRRESQMTTQERKRHFELWEQETEGTDGVQPE
jgi:hypothetical protein